MIPSEHKNVQTPSLSAPCLQTLDTNEQLPQRLLGRYEVPVYGDEVMYRSLVNRLVLSFKLPLVWVFFSLEGGSHQIIRHLRTGLNGPDTGKPLEGHNLYQGKTGNSTSQMRPLFTDSLVNTAAPCFCYSGVCMPTFFARTY
jgi:hypothetical protein